MLKTLLAAVCLVSLLQAAPAAERPADRIALFNGTDLTGWWGLGTEDPAKWQALAADALAAKKAASIADIAKHWRVENGELVNDGNGLYLTTAADYGDFELSLDYLTVAGADSGIYLRGIPQVQIWDTSEAGGKWKLGADKGSGGLWNNSPGTPGKDPALLADKPFGEWNQVAVTMVGERVTVVFNGKIVVDHARLENYFDRSKPVPRTGPIQLQTHGGAIRWRNVHLRPIAVTEAIRILQNGGPKKDVKTAFMPLFNGKDLTGWQGATENYEVVDGALRCKAGKGGTLATSEIYRDFIARIEFRLPPGGNNGLAIRYPGQGDAAYAGMCELQILDSEHPTYARLDARQHHGSAYGIAAAARGYLNPAGEWNWQEVTVIGSTIRVELNGTRILDCDLAKIAPPYHDDKAHPGKDRAEGFFGLAGHHDPVAFRAISILKR